MNRALTMLAGLAFGLLALELALRIPSWSPSVGVESDAFSILALGESTTQGGFLPADQYPAQLETVLLGRCPRLKFRIINAGLAGAKARNQCERWRRT